MVCGTLAHKSKRAAQTGRSFSMCLTSGCIRTRRGGRRFAEARFRVRETPDWKKHASELETEMLKRGMYFEVIDWSEDQAPLPFDG
jgi:hypothetical protein